MVSTALRQAARIERKPNIPSSARTPKKDEAADWIDEHAADNWQQWTFTEVAEETEFSRQHISNTVEDYFQPVDATHNIENDGGVAGQVSGSIEERELPKWVLDAVKDAYRDGYRDGVRDAEER